MESQPTREDAAAALRDAEASRAAIADGVATPSWFFTSIAVAISVQIATTAVGLGDGPVWVLMAGLLFFGAVAGVQLGRFRRRNGVWLGGFASRVVLGTGTLASSSYVLALGAAAWSALEEEWWLVVLCALGGGGAYALSGLGWLRDYRAHPAALARGESAGWLVLGGAAAFAGLVLLLVSVQLGDLDAHLVPPARLRLVTMLTAVSEAEFATIRDALRVSDSVLSKHVTALEGAGYLKRRKGVRQGRRTTWISLSSRGRRALSAHVATLRELTEGIE